VLEDSAAVRKKLVIQNHGGTPASVVSWTISSPASSLCRRAGLQERSDAGIDWLLIFGQKITLAVEFGWIVRVSFSWWEIRSPVRSAVRVISMQLDACLAGWLDQSISAKQV